MGAPPPLKDEAVAKPMFADSIVQLIWLSRKKSLRKRRSVFRKD
jgi:hypothetical protein